MYYSKLLTLVLLNYLNTLFIKELIENPIFTKTTASTLPNQKILKINCCFLYEYYRLLTF